MACSRAGFAYERDYPLHVAGCRTHIKLFNYIYMGTLGNQQKSNSLAKLPTYVRFQTLRTRNFGLRRVHPWLVKLKTDLFRDASGNLRRVAGNPVRMRI